MKFSDRGIKALEIKDKEYQVREAHGFTVRILPSGVKRWEYIYNSPETSKRRRMHLGNYCEAGTVHEPKTDTSLATAHQRHTDARGLVLKGIDPQTLPEPESISEASNKPLTVKELKKKYITHITGGLNEKGEVIHGLDPRSVKNQDNRLEKRLIPVWENKLITDISKNDAIELLESIPKPGAARNILLAGRAMFSYALDRELILFNPFANAGKAVPKTAPNERDRVLDDDELRLVWPLLWAGGKPSILRRAILIILYTGQRPDEVASMPKIEIEPNGRWWMIPKERAKNKREHRVYLSAPVRRLIAPLLLIPGDYVFPASRGAEGPVGVTSLDSHVQRYLGDGEYAGLPRWTPHDLRRTYATGVARLGADDATIDVLQNHAKQGVVRIYNRYKYDPQRRVWAIRWAWEIRRILRSK